jgi:glucose-6-phosphate 1-dehydrogenase
MNTTIKTKPTVFVIFGGTGDLTSRKIAPALYNLFLDGWLPEQFSIIGTGRTQLSDQQFRDNLLKDINQFSRSGKAAPEMLKPIRNLANGLKNTTTTGKQKPM